MTAIEPMTISGSPTKALIHLKSSAASMSEKSCGLMVFTERTYG